MHLYIFIKLNWTFTCCLGFPFS